MIFLSSEIRTMVHHVTKRTGTPVHDEDLEQEIALNAVEAFQRIDCIAHPRALLMKIVYDTVRDHWRRRHSAEDLAAVDERRFAHAPAFEHEIDASRQLESLRTALGKLPPCRRELLDLFYMQDRSIAEIAALHGRSVSAVKMELSRSRQTLARIIRSMSGAGSIVRKSRG